MSEQRQLLAVALQGESTFWLCAPMNSRLPPDWKAVSGWWLYPVEDRSELGGLVTRPTDTVLEVDYSGVSKVQRFAAITADVAATPVFPSDAATHTRPPYYSIALEEMERITALYRNFLLREKHIQSAAATTPQQNLVASEASDVKVEVKVEADSSPAEEVEQQRVRVKEEITNDEMGEVPVAPPKRRRAPVNTTTITSTTESSRGPRRLKLQAQHVVDEEEEAPEEEAVPITHPTEENVEAPGEDDYNSADTLSIDSADEDAKPLSVDRWKQKYIWVSESGKAYLCKDPGSQEQLVFPLATQTDKECTVYVLFPFTKPKISYAVHNASAVESESDILLSNGQLVRLYARLGGRGGPTGGDGAFRVGARRHLFIGGTNRRGGVCADGSDLFYYPVNPNDLTVEERRIESSRTAMKGHRAENEQGVLRSIGYNMWTDGESESSKVSLDTLATQFPLTHPLPGNDLQTAILPNGECVTYTRATATKYVQTPQKESRKFTSVSDEDMRGLLDNILLARKVEGGQ